MASARPSHVLVVDDDAAVRASLAMLLAAMGNRVSLAAGGVAAIDAARLSCHDLVMMDPCLRDMSGNDLIKKLREIAPDMPIIIVSRVSSDAAKRNMSDIPCFEKPLSVELLRSAISDVMENRVEMA